MLRGLPKADVGRGSNTETGIAKPVAPFHHSHRTAVSNLLQTVLRCWLLNNIGSEGGRKFLGHFWRHFISQISEESSKVGHTKRGEKEEEKNTKESVIFVSFSMHMLLSDIWSRSSFWVTVHASWVLMSAKELPVYRRNQSHLLLKMLALFARYDMSEWYWRYLWHKKAFTISQEFPTVSLDVLP